MNANLKRFFLGYSVGLSFTIGFLYWLTQEGVFVMFSSGLVPLGMGTWAWLVASGTFTMCLAMIAIGEFLVRLWKLRKQKCG